MSSNEWEDRLMGLRDFETAVLADSGSTWVGDVTRGGDTLYLRDAVSNSAGRYDARSNVTVDANGNFVGYGNWLSSLVRRW